MDIICGRIWRLDTREQLCYLLSTQEIPKGLYSELSSWFSNRNKRRYSSYSRIAQTSLKHYLHYIHTHCCDRRSEHVSQMLPVDTMKCTCDLPVCKEPLLWI